MSNLPLRKAVSISARVAPRISDLMRLGHTSNSTVASSAATAWRHTSGLEVRSGKQALEALHIAQRGGLIKHVRWSGR